MVIFWLKIKNWFVTKIWLNMIFYFNTASDNSLLDFEMETVIDGF